MNGLLLGHATGVWSCVSSLSSCLAPAPSIARLQSKPQRRDVDSRDRTCTQRHCCVATRRRRAVLCCAAWCRGFLINKRRAAVVDCSIFAIFVARPRDPAPVREGVSEPGCANAAVLARPEPAPCAAFGGGRNRLAGALERAAATILLDYLLFCFELAK